MRAVNNSMFFPEPIHRSVPTAAYTSRRWQPVITLDGGRVEFGNRIPFDSAARTTHSVTSAAMLVNGNLVVKQIAYFVDESWPTTSCCDPQPLKPTLAVMIHHENLNSRDGAEYGHRYSRDGSADIGITRQPARVELRKPVCLKVANQQRFRSTLQAASTPRALPIPNKARTQRRRVALNLSIENRLLSVPGSARPDPTKAPS